MQRFMAVDHVGFFLKSDFMDTVSCYLYYDSFPEIGLKNKRQNVFQYITIYRIITPISCILYPVSVLTRIISPDSCQGLGP